MEALIVLGLLGFSVSRRLQRVMNGQSRDDQRTSESEPDLPFPLQSVNVRYQRLAVVRPPGGERPLVAVSGPLHHSLAEKIRVAVLEAADGLLTTHCGQSACSV